MGSIERNSAVAGVGARKNSPFDPNNARVKPIDASVAYLTEYPPPLRQNSTSFVHLADIHSTTSGTIKSFVKTFPAQFVQNGISHEIAAYLLALEAGLPVAKEAYVMRMKTEMLFRIYPEYKAVLATDEGYSYAWTTQAIDGRPLRYLHSVTEPELQKRLLKWGDLAAVLAFDDLIANEDRTKDNLIAINNGSFVLIDHAEIAGGLGSSLNFTRPEEIFQNRLLNSLFGGKAPAYIKSGMVHAAEKHLDVFRRIQPELTFWLNTLFPGGVEANAALLNFLSSRAAASVTRIRQQNRLLI